MLQATHACPAYKRRYQARSRRRCVDFHSEHFAGRFSGIKLRLGSVAKGTKRAVPSEWVDMRDSLAERNAL
jgi:hypothetical protein